MGNENNGQPVIFRRLDLSKGSKMFDRLDRDWEERLRYDVTRDVYLYTSSTSSHRVYHTQVHKEGETWYGFCSCPHGGRGGDSDLTPCKHIAAALLNDSEYDSGGWQKEGSTPLPLKTSTEEGQKPTEEPTDHQGALVGVEPQETPSIDISKGPRSFRISGLPVTCACAASGHFEQGEMKIEEITDPMPLGRAMHILAEDVVKGNELTPYRIQVTAQIHGVEHLLPELSMLAYSARKLWTQGAEGVKPLQVFFKDPLVEVSMSHTLHVNGIPVTIRGRADVWEVFPKENGKKRAVVLDWKGGRKVRNYSDQMLGYALGTFAKDKDIEEVTVILAWVRLGFSDTLTLTRDDVRGWAKNFLKYSAFWDGRTYTKGEHCDWCGKAILCPARIEALKAGINLYSEEVVPFVTDEQGNLLPIDELVLSMQVARQVEKNARNYLRTVAAEVYSRGPQPVPSQPGNVLWYKPRRKTRYVSLSKGREPLVEVLSTPEMHDLISIKLSDVLNAVAGKAEKGKCAQSKRDIEEKLSNLGAILNDGYTRILSVVKAEKKEEAK